MKKNHRLAIAVSALALTGIALGLTTTGNDDDDQDIEVNLQDLPPAVQQTILQHARGGNIEEIEQSDDDGETVYEVEVETSQGDFEFIVSADGKYLGEDIEEDDADDAQGDMDDQDENDDDDEEQVTIITWDQVPTPAQATFRQFTHGAQPEQVEKITDDDATVYEIEFNTSLGKASLTLTATGEPVELENPVTMQDLPASLRAELQDEYPGAEIVEADAVQFFYYELKIKVDGRTREITAVATGDIEDEYHSDGDDDSDNEQGMSGADDDDDDRYEEDDD